MIDAATLVGKKWPALRREALAFAADPPPSAFMRTIARYALEQAVKHDPALRAIYE